MTDLIEETPSQTLSDYVAKAKDSEETWLGTLCWYSLSDIAVPHRLIKQALAGLKDVDIPPRPADHDVFRRVTAKQKQSRVRNDSDPDKYYNYLLREFSTNERIVRRVVRETVDAKGARLDYEEMVDLVFTRDSSSKPADSRTGTVRRESRPGVTPDSHSELIVSNVLTEFQSKRGTVNAQGIREWIRHYLIANKAISVRPSGGLYFLSKENEGALAVIESLTDAVNGEIGVGTIDYHSLPLIDSGRQRSMVRRAFEADTASAVDTQMEEITKLLSSGKRISPRRFEAIAAEYERLRSRSEEYENLLSESMTDTQTRTEFFGKQLTALLDQVNYGDAK